MKIDPPKFPALPKQFTDDEILTANKQTRTHFPPGPDSNLRDTQDRIFFPDPDEPRPTEQNIKDWAEKTCDDYRKAIRDSHDHGYTEGVAAGQKNISKDAMIHLIAKGAGLGISIAGPAGYWLAQHRNKKAQSPSTTS